MRMNYYFILLSQTRLVEKIIEKHILMYETRNVSNDFKYIDNINIYFKFGQLWINKGIKYINTILKLSKCMFCVNQKLYVR